MLSYTEALDVLAPFVADYDKADAAWARACKQGDGHELAEATARRDACLGWLLGGATVVAQVYGIDMDTVLAHAGGVKAVREALG